jgi:hypothetical protein
MKVTEKLLAELNAARGVQYPEKGYSYFADIRGNGGPIRRAVWTIMNGDGGVTRSCLNGKTARETCENIRAAIRAV